MSCTKCNSTMLKYFDEFYHVCTNCGTLAALPEVPSHLPLPPRNESYHRSNASAYNDKRMAIVVNEVKRNAVAISDARSKGFGWKRVKQMLDLQGGLTSIIRHYREMFPDKDQGEKRKDGTNYGAKAPNFRGHCEQTR